MKDKREVFINLMSIGNVSNRKEFIKELNTIPVVKEKIMGTLAHFFEEQGIAKDVEQGIAKGIAEGIAKGKRETALAMLAEGLDIRLVKKITKLDIQEINKLKEQSLKED